MEISIKTVAIIVLVLWIVALIITLLVAYLNRKDSYEKNGLNYIRVGKGVYVNFAGILLVLIIVILITIYLILSP